MITDSVLSDECFYRFSGCAQPLGKATSMMQWNPPDSGTVCLIHKMLFWSSNGTEFNIKWRTEPWGTVFGTSNSLYLRPTGTVRSKSLALSDRTGWNGALPDSFANVLAAADRQACDIDFDPPIALAPGTGIVIYPDTLAVINWTWSLFFEERAL